MCFLTVQTVQFRLYYCLSISCVRVIRSLRVWINKVYFIENQRNHKKGRCNTSTQSPTCKGHRCEEDLVADVLVLCIIARNPGQNGGIHVFWCLCAGQTAWTLAHTPPVPDCSAGCLDAHILVLVRGCECAYVNEWHLVCFRFWFYSKIPSPPIGSGIGIYYSVTRVLQNFLHRVFLKI